jgi:hypothetical protein
MPNPQGIVALAGLAFKEFAVFLFVFAAALLMVWLVPKWQAARIRQSAMASNQEKIETENELRRTVVQIWGARSFCSRCTSPGRACKSTAKRRRLRRGAA